MIDRKILRSLLEKMEGAAEETLQQDPAFYQALQGLKREIDSDPDVRSTVSKLQAAGRRVFSSFVPHVKVRVRTEEGIFALPRPARLPLNSEMNSELITEPLEMETVGRLNQELRNAASAVIKRSRYYHELDTIVTHAVGASDRFEGIASQIESAGYEVLICLDLSSYTQSSHGRVAADQANPIPGNPDQLSFNEFTSGQFYSGQAKQPSPSQALVKSQARTPYEQRGPMRLSASDRQFLKALRIKID